MFDPPLGESAARLTALVVRYPWQAFAIVLVVVLLVTMLLRDEKSDRSSGGDFDLGLFGGDGDGGDGGGD
jgi:hypothetical protein